MTALHDEALVADLHNDLILLVDHFDHRGRTDYFGEFWLPELHAGGVNVQVLPVFIDEQFQSEGALRRTLLLVERIHRLAEQYPQTTVCRTGADVARATADGRIALVIALEGAHALGQDPALIRTMERVGVRVVSLAHLGRTLLADGSGVDDSACGGLTPQGLEVLAEMERLGIVYDISHLGVAGVEDVLEHARRPLLATHSACRAVTDIHRNLTDAQLKGIADLGGVIGVAAAIPPFIDPGRPTVARVVDHIEHLASVTSIDAIALGPDFIDDYYQDVHGGWVVPGMDVTWADSELRRPSDLPRITEEMAERGFPDADIKKVLGGNAMRVFDEVMGVPATTRTP
ncbi:dipeptidase [Streptomyces flavofungini]|uniref:Dipeptidase n=1 Tax=Streptomyces flavofungini TaxID=68200 RepID=A0ABS0X8U3_9ACTN|nr:dipeptidase [Streptomyces flavofungini]MBJ3809416.1 dipeptidase [Streptomyces flavofungini]GHC78156.1 peptidase M19 [Streptomyces flavofungini]